MTDQPLVQATGIHKRYPGGRGRAGFTGLLRALRGVAPAGGFQALRGVDLRVDRGEAVAILGENGAGKSTLLKIISGVLRPSAGELQVHGRVSALLELGAGFHPDFTGRQNLHTAAGLAGVPSGDIERLVPDMVVFAGLEADIDRPLKHYSSGMVVRLGFALMTVLSPDLLISDEVLAVGDESFQKKCIRWLQDYLAGGGTLLLVSHSIYHVQKLCHRALWLHQGAVREAGDVFRVSQAYLAYHDHKLRGDGNLDGTAKRVIELTVNGADRAGPWPEIAHGGDLQFQAVSRNGGSVDRVRLQLNRADGSPVTELSLAPGEPVSWSRVPLLPGQYLIQAEPQDRQGQRCGEPERVLLRVTGEAREFGSVRLPREWGDSASG